MDATVGSMSSSKSLREYSGRNDLYSSVLIPSFHLLCLLLRYVNRFCNEGGENQLKKCIRALLQPAPVAGKGKGAGVAAAASSSPAPPKFEEVFDKAWQNFPHSNVRATEKKESKQELRVLKDFCSLRSTVPFCLDEHEAQPTAQSHDHAGQGAARGEAEAENDCA
jgi:hypothetical protein